MVQEFPDSVHLVMEHRVISALLRDPASQEIDTALVVGLLVRPEAEVVGSHKFPDETPFPVIVPALEKGEIADTVHVVEVIVIRNKSITFVL
ncbi:MAG: hypothetical protein A2Y33_08570 [Spirochaetes bacterium GWF1_51_8]|nr:MAG: hypothetical protein A2Y33_08570 [Spirochaetes bacterium GWF1_51_8]